MSDFSSFVVNYNTATDSSPNWSGTAIAFGGSSGANEFRFAPSSGATASTPSASWPYVTRPSSGTTVVPQLWAFTADATGSQINYSGDVSKVFMLRWSWDAIGTFASAPQFSAFGDTTHTAPSPGTQPGGQSGSPIINGSSDTSNAAYLKANAFGYGVDSSGNQQTPATGSLSSTTLAVTSGTAGAVVPGSAAWLGTFQSLQGWVQYIQSGATPKALAAGYWYFVLVLYVGVGLSTGTLQPVITMQYAYS